jgi:hypothetical protein
LIGLKFFKKVLCLFDLLLYLVCRLLALALTFCGFAKKRIAKRNLSFKNAACTMEDFHVYDNTAFCKGAVVGSGSFHLISFIRV